MDRPPLPTSPRLGGATTPPREEVSPVLRSTPAPSISGRMDADPLASSSTSSISSVINTGEKKNWHQRKISWAMDTLYVGEAPGEESTIPTNRLRNSNERSPPRVHTSRLRNSSERSPPPPSAAAAAAAATAAALEEEVDDINARQAAYIQSLFAGAPPRRHHHHRKISSLGGLELSDIIKESPMEQEAETYILKAIEERVAEVSKEEIPAAFPNVPDDAISALSTNPDADTATDADTETVNTPSPPLLMPHHHTHNINHNDPPAYSPVPSASTTTRPQSRRPSLVSSVSSRTLVPPHSSNTTYHRRKQTMEQHLFGLASAIDAIQSPAEDSQEESALFGEDILPITSATTLEQNANLLYNNLVSSPKKEEEESGSSSVESDDDKHTSAETSATAEVANNSVTWDPSNSHLDYMEEGGESGSDKEKEKATLDSTHHATNTKVKKKQKQKKKNNLSNLRELQDFFAPQKTTIALYLRVMFLYIGTPLLGIAAILFYWADNPPTGRMQTPGTGLNEDGDAVDPTQPSIAWWLIFAARQIVTFTLAKVTEILFIDYLTIRSRGTMNILGPWATLFILQSRGWPSTITLWSIFNFCLLSGSSDFPKHWLYWQDMIGLFNEENPAGNVVDSSWNYRILAIGLVLGIVVSIKRLFLGLYLGKRTFESYADQLANIMKNILMISEVSALAKDLEREMRIRTNHRRGSFASLSHLAAMTAQREKLIDILDDAEDDGASAVGLTQSINSVADKSYAAPGKVDYVIDPEDRNPWSGLLSFTQQQRIIQLLGAWEEPVIAEKPVEEHISVSALLQFRRSMACLNTPMPFGGAFGLADKREQCIQSAQDVYRRLLLNNQEQQGDLSFETLALLGLKPDGTLDQPKLKELIRLFRPDRDGTLTILHFVKSIDKVYKDIRLLRASVTNTSKIDKSFETIVNWIFYVIAFTIILSILGYSPMALFLSISGVILAFAFMIGSASSKYFEGLLFILVRRPYAIGDGIHVMGVESEGIFTGHPFWYVEDVSLFTTSVMYMFTGERATLSNGSLANSRIVNATRSPQAWMYTMLKFPVDVSLEKLQIFNTALEQFFRNRPREWRSYDSFRATRLDAQAGFIEYMVVCTHRNSWHDWGTVHVSKADMIHFCMELSKQLGIFYRTPPMPVDLTVRSAQHMSFASNPAEFLGPAPAPEPMMGPLTAPPQQPNLEDLQSRFPPRLR